MTAGEPALLRRMLETFDKRDIVVFDRYYYPYMMLAMLIGQGVDVCTRLHSNRDSDFRRGRRLGPDDHLITWCRPAKPAWMSAQDIPVTSTPCFYGGVRVWLRCPVVSKGLLCENRVGKLYLPPGGRVFGCRHCHDLTYESCQKSHKYDRVFDHLKELDIENLNINQVLRLGGL